MSMTIKATGESNLEDNPCCANFNFFVMLTVKFQFFFSRGANKLHVGRSRGTKNIFLLIHSNWHCCNKQKHMFWNMCACIPHCTVHGDKATSSLHYS